MTDVTSELRSIRRTAKVVNTMLWLIVSVAVFYSLMTSTPLVASHSQWEWSGWALGVLTDAAFILSITADAVLSKHGMRAGPWGTGFRWVTGFSSLFLNAWSSFSEDDWVGVAIHSIAPAILICAAEVAPSYRRKFKELEVTLTRKSEEVTVSQALVTRKSNTSNAKPNVTNAVTKDSDAVTNTPVSNARTKATPAGGGTAEGKYKQPRKGNAQSEKNKEAIQKAFLDKLSPTEAAEKIGVSRSYVSQRYKKIREELEKAA
ncbi:sigma factor-like helix-turn-helix DNA-binding protein [Streptomyces sp. P6-2-1]|uniref:sigma factor-like helix-turn-helix DNA-binding protein n=1 Tax=Streptomyces sp. P6-2-1 TaxID=3422591 RepID=UPI003D36CA27